MKPSRVYYRLIHKAGGGREKTTAAIVLPVCSSLSELMFVVASDHLIEVLPKDDVTRAAELARDWLVVTFGWRSANPKPGSVYPGCHDDEVLSFYREAGRSHSSLLFEAGDYLISECFYFG